jgi:hypothetical protein
MHTGKMQAADVIVPIDQSTQIYQVNKKTTESQLQTIILDQTHALSCTIQGHCIATLPHTIVQLSNLVRVNLAHGTLHDINALPLLSKLHNAQEIDISFNKLETLNENEVWFNSTLKKLNCSHNAIGKVNIPLLMHQFPNIQEVDLSSCPIYHVNTSDIPRTEDKPKQVPLFKIGSKELSHQQKVAVVARSITLANYIKPSDRGCLSTFLISSVGVALIGGLCVALPLAMNGMLSSDGLNLLVWGPGFTIGPVGGYFMAAASTPKHARTYKRFNVVFDKDGVVDTSFHPSDKEIMTSWQRFVTKIPYVCCCCDDEKTQDQTTLLSYV